eukprot:m.640836 g.640836  ORF g.640836 m.640836 type:complete len:391 (+) comp58344_c2_seq6:446-1618(+)
MWPSSLSISCWCECSDCSMNLRCAAVSAHQQEWSLVEERQCSISQGRDWLWNPREFLTVRITGDHAPAFERHHLERRIQQHQCGNALHLKVLAEGEFAGVCVCIEREPGHAAEVCLEALAVLVRRDKDNLKRLLLRLQLAVQLDQSGSEGTTGRTPLRTEIESNILVFNRRASKFVALVVDEGVTKNLSEWLWSPGKLSAFSVLLNNTAPVPRHHTALCVEEDECWQPTHTKPAHQLILLCAVAVRQSKKVDFFAVLVKCCLIAIEADENNLQLVSVRTVLLEVCQPLHQPRRERAAGRAPQCREVQPNEPAFWQGALAQQRTLHQLHPLSCTMAWGRGYAKQCYGARLQFDAALGAAGERAERACLRAGMGLVQPAPRASPTPRPRAHH